MAKILVYSPNVIGKSMAGAAIRSWEFAKSLAQEHQVVLISPEQAEVESKDFEIVSLRDRACKRHFRQAAVLVTQRLTVPLALTARSHQVKVIIDAYDPSPLELFEHFKMEPVKNRHQKILSEISTLLFSFKMANGMICASEKQRELWIGFLMAQKRITSAVYNQDPSLRHFIDVVPFGLSPHPPQKNGQGMREKYRFNVDDKVILWGGGIWNWFDPLSLIKAMKIVSQTRMNVKLVFMGIKPPDPLLPVTSMSSAAIQLARELDLLNQSVFFNHEWVSYEERQNFLLDADLGVSTHFNHLETQFSFRTRILDYLWAQLPIITTEGDTFAELVDRHDLGKVVPYQNPQAIADAILMLIDDPKRIREIKERLAIVRKGFYWSSAVTPLKEMIERISRSTACSRCIWEDGATFLNFIFSKLREKGIGPCFRGLLQTR